MTDHLPELALSVRQPWAWAIIHGGKDIENRTQGSVVAGKMKPGRICIHAATGMAEREYCWAVWKMAQIAVTVPPPDQLPRGAIIGTVTVTDIVSDSESPWFGGPMGLVLAEPEPVAPFPATGELGYYHWERRQAPASVKPWMQNYGLPKAGGETADLFPDMALSFRAPPEKPFKTRK